MNPNPRTQRLVFYYFPLYVLLIFGNLLAASYISRSLGRFLSADYAYPFSFVLMLATSILLLVKFYSRFIVRGNVAGGASIPAGDFMWTSGIDSFVLDARGKGRAHLFFFFLAAAAAVFCLVAVGGPAKLAAADLSIPGPDRMFAGGFYISIPYGLLMLYRSFRFLKQARRTPRSGGDLRISPRFYKTLLLYSLAACLCIVAMRLLLSYLIAR